MLPCLCHCTQWLELAAQVLSLVLVLAAQLWFATILQAVLTGYLVSAKHAARVAMHASGAITQQRTPQGHLRPARQPARIVTLCGASVTHACICVCIPCVCALCHAVLSAYERQDTGRPHGHIQAAKAAAAMANGVVRGLLRQLCVHNIQVRGYRVAPCMQASQDACWDSDQAPGCHALHRYVLQPSTGGPSQLAAYLTAG